MRSFAFLLMAFLAPQISFCQTGKIFPNISGTSLEGEEVEIPKETNGKFTLLGLAYSKKAEDDLKSWFEPTYNKFVAHTGFMDDTYDVHLYFMPMFTGLNKIMTGRVTKDLKKDLQEDLKPHVLMYKGDVDRYEEELRMQDKKSPYFFVLDSNGTVVWKGKGRFSQKKLDDVVSVLLDE